MKKSSFGREKFQVKAVIEKKLRRCPSHQRLRRTLVKSEKMRAVRRTSWSLFEPFLTLLFPFFAVPLDDPAILSRRRGSDEKRHRYSPSQLKSLRELPVCKRVPNFFDPRMNYWRRPGRNGDDEAPARGERRERSNYDSNGSSNGSRSEGNRREPPGGKDSRAERLKKEDTNIILSPQRRSFNMGCQMPAAPSSNQPPLGPALLRNDRDILNGSRRIGSGRIVSRDIFWEYRADKKEDTSTDFLPPRNSSSSSSSFERSERRNNYRDNNFEKESSSSSSSRRDYDRSSAPPRSYNSSGQSRYNDRRRQYNDGKDDEPEWFSGGPTSQHDTIELHGFDGPVEEEKKSSSSKERNKESKVADLQPFEAIEEEEKPLPAPVAKKNDTNNNKDADNGQKSGELGDVLGNKLTDDGFNFEEFLNLDSISGLLTAVSTFLQCVFLGLNLRIPCWDQKRTTL